MMHRLMILSIVFVCAVGVASAFAADSPEKNAIEPRPSGGTGGKVGTFKDERIEVDGKQRAYRLVVPKTVTGKKPVPLVFAFHGFLIDSKDLMSLYSRLDQLAAEKTFVLVYPNALDRHWPLVPGLIDRDYKFFDALYEHITAKFNIDLNRVYLTGMSNGGYFTHCLASVRSDKIAALACHSGGLGFVGFSKPKTEHPWAAMIIHGTDDSIVKVAEGRKAAEIYESWGYPVKYVEVPKLNHFWAHKADINHQIWDFFEEHPLVLTRRETWTERYFRRVMKSD